MKIAIISPVECLGYCDYGDIHMSLAHLVVENGFYAAYYRNLVTEGKFVILDNSAFEFEKQGIGVPLDTIFEAAKLIQPSELIATDILFKGPETIESTKAFIDALPDDLRGTRIMAVPQGRSKEEWFQCLDDLLHIPEVNTIGLSKLSVPACWAGTHQKSAVVAHSRLECVREIILQHHILTKLQGHKEVHLLGGDDWNAWELGLHQQPKTTQQLTIRSCDSSVTVWYGAHGQCFNQNTGTMDRYILEKPDLECAWWDTASNIDSHESDILHNIAVLHRFSKGG